MSNGSKPLEVPRAARFFEDAVNSFRLGFEKRLEKTAILGAALAHVGQNVFMRKILRNRRFGKSLAGQFQEGVAGKSPGAIKQFFHGVASGATVPEVKMMRDHARELGGHAAQSLREKGVTNLSLHDIRLARSLSQGRFSRLLDPKHFDAANPTHKAILDVANKHFGTGITHEMLAGHNKEQLAEHVGHLEKAWRDKQSPVTSNIFAQMTKNPGKAKFVPRGELSKVTAPVGHQPIDLKPKASLAGGLIGSAATGVVDPATGALNAGKIVATNSASRGAISALPAGQRALAATDKRFIADPVRNAGKAGMQGQAISPVRHALNTYGMNAATAEFSNSANRLGMAANRAPAARNLRKVAFWTGFEKRALLRPEVELQPQQERVKRKLQRSGGLLVYHGLGSGKTLTSLNAAQGLKDVDVVVPASLRNNYRKEVEKHTTGFKPHIMSYEAATKEPERRGNLLVVDEVHNLGDNTSKRSQKIQQMAKNYDRRVFLTATPLKNRPSELGPVMAGVRGDRAIPVDPKAFDQEYIEEHHHYPGFFAKVFKGAKPGVTYRMKNEKKLRGLLDGFIDYHKSGSDHFPSVSHEVIEEPMSDEQSKYYDFAMGKANPAVAYKIRHGLPASKSEAKSFNTFLSGTRQISNTAAGFGGAGLSPKIQRAVDELQKRHQTDKNFRGVVYSNFLDSGVKAYAGELAKRNISHGVFTGELNDNERKDLVDQYNSGRISTLLISGSGAQGIDLKGTKLLQIIEPHWNENRLAQATGRAVRYKSHDHLPEDQRSVHVQRFVSLAPQGRLARMFGAKRDMSVDQYLYDMSAQKEKLNNAFLDVLREVGQK